MLYEGVEELSGANKPKNICRIALQSICVVFQGGLHIAREKRAEVVYVFNFLMGIYFYPFVTKLAANN